MRILHTMLRVGDLERSIDFYTRVLGMQLLRTTDRPEQKYTLAFVGYGDERDGRGARAHVQLRRRPLRPRHGYGHVAIEVDDAAAACDAVRDEAPKRRQRHARGGAGQGRHDRHRVRAGPRRLQDRADRARARTAELVPGTPARTRARRTASARGEHLVVGALEQRARSPRESAGVEQRQRASPPVEMRRVFAKRSPARRRARRGGGDSRRDRTRSAPAAPPR